MKERIFNLYHIIRNGIIRELAMVHYLRDGTDDEKMAFLQSVCRKDYHIAKHYPVPDGWLYIDCEGNQSAGISWDTYINGLIPLMGATRWFEAAFETVADAPHEPLVVITCVGDGKVKIEKLVDIDHGVMP